MKKKIVLLCTVLVTLASFAAVTGCVRSDDDYYYYYGNVTFWNDDLNEDIRVNVDGLTEYITYNYEPYSCNASGRANFYLQEGSHYYTARSLTRGYTWDGYINVNRDGCVLFELYR